MRFFIVDTFTNELFGGNPAGVVLIEGGEYPSFDIMVKTAAELRYSETAFLRHIKESEYEVRYFTPTDEVDLCGHATIATFSVMGKSENLKKGESKSYVAHTKAGNIEINVSKDLVMMEMAKPELIKTYDDINQWNEIRKVLGLKEKGVKEKDLEESLTPALVTTGLPDILCPVDSVKELNSINPDFDAMSKLSERENAVGVHAYTIVEHDNPLNSNNTKPNIQSNIEIHSRNFAPLFGIPEEAATGTSNGALTYYLNQKNIIKDGVLNSIEQGKAMGRPSQIYTIAEKDNDGNTKIRVGGSAVILAEGEINLD